MANITIDTDKIRNADWLRDVRAGIADAIDAINNDSISTIAKEAQLELLEKSLRTQYDAQIANMALTNPDFAEGVASHVSNITGKSFDTLGHRMDDHDTSINTLTSGVSTNKTDITNAKANIATNTANITELLKANISETAPRFVFNGFLPALYHTQCMQSLAYVEADDVILAGYKIYSGTESTCTIRKWSRKTKKIIANYDNLNLYHCSDMTYNPNTKELFISTNTDPRGRNYIEVYNYPAMTFKREFQYAYKSIVYGIAYSKDYNQFVFYDDSDICICDVNMVKILLFGTSNLGMNYQNIEVYKNYIYIYYDTAIQIYDFKGNLITTYDIQPLDEGEGLCSLGDGNFLLGRCINSPVLTASISSRVYIFNTTIPCQRDFYPYLISGSELAYDKISVEDTIVLINGVYTLSSNLDGNYNYYPNSGNLNKTITYNATQNDLVFNCAWDEFVELTGIPIVQSGLSIALDHGGAQNLDLYNIQFAYFTALGLEMALYKGGVRVSPAGIDLAKLNFKWDFYVKSLNV